MNHSQELALIALREEALRMAKEADGAIGTTGETDYLQSWLPKSGTLLPERVTTCFSDWSEWDELDGVSDDFVRRAQKNRDECRGLRRWIDGKL